MFSLEVIFNPVKNVFKKEPFDWFEKKKLTNNTLINGQISPN